MQQSQDYWANRECCGQVLHGEVAWEIPIDIDDVENEMRYNFALGKTLMGTCDWQCFNYLTPYSSLTESVPSTASRLPYPVQRWVSGATSCRDQLIDLINSHTVTIQPFGHLIEAGRAKLSVHGKSKTFVMTAGREMIK